MRIDKLTTKFQEALADAQSLALAHDHAYIEPQHLLLAMLEQTDGATLALLTRAGVRATELREAVRVALKNFPQVTGGDVQVSRDLNNLLNQSEKLALKRGDEFIASELFLLALADDSGSTGKLMRAHGLDKKP